MLSERQELRIIFNEKLAIDEEMDIIFQIFGECDDFGPALNGLLNHRPMVLDKSRVARIDLIFSQVTEDLPMTLILGFLTIGLQHKD